MPSATKTFTRWREWIPQMRVAAEEHLPAARAIPRRPRLFPSFWDSDSFAENLWWAAQGSFSKPVLDPAGYEVRLKYCICIDGNKTDTPKAIQKSFTISSWMACIPSAVGFS